MQRAKLFDGIDSAGRPYVDPERAEIDGEFRTRVLEFLQGGRLVLRTTFRDTDRIEPERGRVVPTSTFTDGDWVWNAAVAYYLRVHGIAPDPEFLEHIVERDFNASTASDAEVSSALQLLRH